MEKKIKRVERMTENKRFRLAWENFDGWAILDTTGEYSDEEDYIDWFSGQKAVDVLNELNDKCEFLEIENESLEDGATKYAELYHKSLKENEQLKKDCTALIYHNQDYRKENERLKNGIKLLQEENDDLNKFFLHNCKTSDYLKWKKEKVE